MNNQINEQRQTFGVSLNHHLNNEFSPALGHSNITDEEVVHATEAIIQRVAVDYFKMTDSSNERDIYFKPTSGLSVVYPDKDQKHEERKINDGRFYFNKMIKIKDLKNDDALDHLLQKLSKTISALGYTDKTGEFDIRFEKGCVKPAVDGWHFDEGFKTSITVCWSNKGKWCTRILNMGKSTENLKEFRESMTGINRAMNAKYLNFKYAEDTVFGDLYDALNLCHVAPGKEVFNYQTPLAHYYRFFVRYIEG